MPKFPSPGKLVQKFRFDTSCNDLGRGSRTVTDIREEAASNVGPSLITSEDCRAVVLSHATNPRVLGRGCDRPAARQFPDVTAPQIVNRVFALREIRKRSGASPHQKCHSLFGPSPKQIAMMTSNQRLPRVTAGLSAASSQPFHAGSLAAVVFGFKKSDKILWVDRLTVALTPGSITALQSPAKEKNFYA
jgi:hypothetical protein